MDLSRSCVAGAAMEAAEVDPLEAVYEVEAAMDAAGWDPRWQELYRRAREAVLAPGEVELEALGLACEALEEMFANVRETEWDNAD